MKLNLPEELQAHAIIISGCVMGLGQTKKIAHNLAKGQYKSFIVVPATQRHINLFINKE